MSLKTCFICEAALAIQTSIIAHEADIESLDRAIGDGDHYINVKRGADMIAQMTNEIEDLTPDEALNKIAMKLLSTIGGAAGPLFASFFMEMAKLVKHNQADTPLEIAAAFAAGVQGIVHRGKAGIGEKTMLDVLIPVSTTFTLGAAAGNNVAEICQTVKAAADQGLENTRNLIATKGRAAGLGERAIGHLDAGAKSSQVMVHAVCDLLLKEKKK
ncbi:MAG: dihydroxyacetone kinase subunit DhaL [Methylophilaceae bacterium]